MSIYKVISVKSAESITLQCQVEKKAPKIVIFDKSLSSTDISKGTYIAARILIISPTSYNSKRILSHSYFEIPFYLIKECVTIIHNITNAMYNPLSALLINNGEVIKDTKSNRLLTKKMWSKEILETWYAHNTNYVDYH
jgi:hypothetical protein